MSVQFEQPQQWVGRKESKTDTAAAWPVIALAATLDRHDPEPVNGAIPPGWHWLYFLEAKPASELGPDGHPRRGGFLPPVPLPRRMWAGGRIEFRRALKVGETLRRDSEIISVEPKQGKSGSLVFVTVRHTVNAAANDIAVVEEHDIVYREASSPAPPGREVLRVRGVAARDHPDPVLLFRFSALTFNGHRIHDLDYSSTRKLFGLIVHGPLQTIYARSRRREEVRPVKLLVAPASGITPNASP